METLPRDSAPEKPVDRRLPLKQVTFTHPVPVPGFKSMATTVVSGGYRMDDGENKPFPQVFLDPVIRTIQVGEAEYPLERVVVWVRAKFAISKPPAPAPLPNYTIGNVTRPKAPSK